ncbi:hypothetical protein C8J57DRAFT_1538822 [Mycena rebaudengoi]|nr:hypothetical protein C8J57DRAFT_1538822 [Mycena rebaudengoi]
MDVEPTPLAVASGPHPSAWQCLNDIDILSEVLICSPREMNGSQESRSLLNIALVCKAFLEPALDELWWTVETLIPLLRLAAPKKKTTPLRKSFHWDKFDYYARRVRCIVFADATEISKHSALFLQITQLHGTPVLPRLRTISGIRLSSEAHILFSPSIRAITLESDHHPIVLALLAGITGMGGTVEELRLDLTGEVESSLCAGIANLNTLRRLEVTVRDMPLSEYVQFDAALAKSQLALLHLSAPPQWDKDISDHILSSGFSKLEAFIIDGGSISFLPHAQGAIAAPRDWKPVFSLLSGRWAASLEVISLDLQNSSMPEKFGALFGFLDGVPHLQQLHIMHYGPIVLNDTYNAKLLRAAQTFVN